VMQTSSDYSSSVAETLSEPVYQVAAPVAAPAYVLFDAQAVTVAAFFGFPVAGTALMAVNYSRLGQKGKAVTAVLIGLLVTAAAITLGNFMPGAGTVPIAVALLYGVRWVAIKLQGKAVAQHVWVGGRLGSKWIASGVGVVFFCLALACFLPTILGQLTDKVTIGKNDEVYYKGSASAHDAKALGEALKTSGYFTDRGTSVFLTKDINGATISLVQHEGVWDRPGMLASAEEVAREVAPAVGGFPVHVKLINSAEVVKKEGIVGRAIIGSKDEIFYFGNATPTEAQAFGKALKNADYLSDKGTDVMLSKDGDGTVISYVVGDGYWDKADAVAGFEKMTRDAASTVGGLPIKMHLVNTALEVKKEIVLQ
jgi:hypothetical protein